MKRKIIWSAALFVLVCLATSKAGRAVCYDCGGGGGGVTCSAALGTGCEGVCQDDVCPTGQTVTEYSCSDGSILYVNE